MPAIKRLFLVLFLLVSCSPMGGCPESDFKLEPDSRLPKWFSLPPGYTRSDVTVELGLFTELYDQKGLVTIDNAVLIMYDRKRRIFTKVTGQNCWHPIMEKKRSPHGGYITDSTPDYTYLIVNGILEVLEFPSGLPTFRISDDSVLKKAAIEATHCDKGEYRSPNKGDQKKRVI
ncbi:MAG: hypothetical protein HY036_06530 [Nitrospirae bacterium]|nr:hypothetical protein [Nitrospirota bacterium]